MSREQQWIVVTYHKDPSYFETRYRLKYVSLPTKIRPPYNVLSSPNSNIISITLRFREDVPQLLSLDELSLFTRTGELR